MEEEDRDEHEGKARRSEEKVISEEVDVEDKFNIVKVLNKSEGNAWAAAPVAEEAPVVGALGW